MGIPLAIILGPDEVAQDHVSIKILKSGEQITIEKGDTERALLQLLESLPAS